MMIELTTCNGRKLLVNSKHLITALEANNGHSFLEVVEYNHSIEVIQSIETIKKLLNDENT